jgi:hypothetical protein
VACAFAAFFVLAVMELPAPIMVMDYPRQNPWRAGYTAND